MPGAAGALQQHDVEDALYAAAVANGLVADDRERKCWATIRSGLSAGRREPVESGADGGGCPFADAAASEPRFDPSVSAEELDHAGWFVRGRPPPVGSTKFEATRGRQNIDAF